MPLSTAALETLARAYAEAKGTTASVAERPIFPSAKRTTPLSDMALSAVMRRMNADKPEDLPVPWRDADGRVAVPHGFRATFSTWVDDTRPHEREAAEKALAHAVGNKVSAAYRRMMAPERSEKQRGMFVAGNGDSSIVSGSGPLMEAWGGFCTRAPARVASLDAARAAKMAT